MVAVTADQVRKPLGLTSEGISNKDIMAFVAEVIRVNGSHTRNINNQNK